MSDRPHESADLTLQQRLFEPLDRLRRRCRLYLSIAGGARVALALVAAGLIQLGVDRWLRLSALRRAK